MLVDSHCHLDYKVLTNKLNDIILEANKNHVYVLQTICTKISQFSKIYQISKLYKNIFCSIGNHPLNIMSEGIVGTEEMLKYTTLDKVIGIGETGLDYHSKDDKKSQQNSFINHIIASQESSLPIIIHTRLAEQDTVNILKQYMKVKNFTGVIHCFTASEWFARQCLDFGLYISASGIITFKNAKVIQQTFKKIPLEKLLIETDSPYLAPVPMRGKYNQPSYLKYTATYVAQLLNVDFNYLAKKTTKNFFDLFKKATYTPTKELIQ